MNAVVGTGPAEVPRKPPDEVLTGLDTPQRVDFERLWFKLPAHLHDVNFDFDQKIWTPDDIDALGGLLRANEHRFSRHSTDLGRATLDPFRIILEKDARPIKQRHYRYSPQTSWQGLDKIDKLVLGGILRRSYSNYSSPPMVIAKANGSIRLTCDYKRVSE